MQQGRYSKVTKWDVPTSKCVGLSYCRVSTPGQVSGGNGLTTQETTNKQLFDKIEIPIIKIFYDTYTGGGDFMERPAMRELFQFIDTYKGKEPLVFVMDDLKRFARDVFEHILLKREFSKRGVEVRCTNYDFDDSPEGVFAENIIASSNQYDRESNRRQVLNRQKGRALGGYYPFPCAHIYGYKMQKYAEHGLMPTPDKDADIVAEMCVKFSRKELLRFIDGARFLREKGVLKTKVPEEKQIETVKSILLNPLYAGYIHIPKFEIEYHPGKHKALISDETFRRNVARILGADKDLKSITKRQINAFDDDMPLRGLIKCAACNNCVTGARNGKGFCYYQCNTRGCKLKGKTMSSVKANEELEKILKDNECSQAIIDLTTAIFADVWRDEVQNAKESERASLRQVESLQKQIDKLVDSAASTTSDAMRKQYETRADKLLKDLELLSSKQVIDFESEEMYRTSLYKVLGYMKSPYSLWVSSSVMQKRDLFKFIFEENPIYEKNVGYRTVQLSLPNKVFRDVVGVQNTQSSGQVEMAGIEPASKRA
jgi:site-specific DNA recombinase